MSELPWAALLGKLITGAPRPLRPDKRPLTGLLLIGVWCLWLGDAFLSVWSVGVQMMSILLVLKWLHWAVSDRRLFTQNKIGHFFFFLMLLITFKHSDSNNKKQTNKQKQLKKHTCWTIKSKFSGCRVLKNLWKVAGVHQRSHFHPSTVQKSLSCPSFLYISLETQNGHTSVVLRWCFSEYPVKVTSSIRHVCRSSDGCFSTKLTWSLLQVHCWQKHFLILYVTDSQILQLSDNFQVLWPSVAPGSLLFSYFIWVVGIKRISVKRLKYLVRFLVARYIASVSHALVACTVRHQPASFFAIVEQKGFMTVFIH